MSAERLQKVLARAGVASRRKVEEMIQQGRVTIDGRLAVVGDKADLDQQTVKVDGKRIAPAKKERTYLLVNKPAGCVSTVSDPEGRATVMDLLPQRMRHGLVPVGRLDYATEGLLILTDDGDFAHHVAHPRFGCRKTYEVKVKGRPPATALDKLRDGIFLDGKRTAPARISAGKEHRGPRDSQENSWWVVILSEGRSRQIREMFRRIGHPVARLRRVAIGSLIDPSLPRGGWRELLPAEVEELRRRTAKGKPKEKASKPKRPKPAKPSRPERSNKKAPAAGKKSQHRRGPKSAKNNHGR